MNWWGLARREETSRDPTRRKRNRKYVNKVKKGGLGREKREK